MSCVDACPAVGALDLETGFRGRYLRTRPWMMATAILVIFIGIVGYARIMGFWETHLPEATYFELVPRAAEYAHPR